MTKAKPDTERQLLAFRGDRLFRQGTLNEIWADLSATIKAGLDEPILVFDAATGKVIDIDPRQPPDAASAPAPSPPKKPRGRPRLGVVAREVTLLPQHWEWLASQHGGASAALRSLINQAKRDQLRGASGKDQKNAAYNFMNGIAGNLPGFEEALRALFADDRAAFATCIADWPADIRREATRLAFPDQTGA